MKTKILAGLVTALFYGGIAMAQETDVTKGQDTQQQPPESFGGSGLEDDDIILDQQDVPPVSPDLGGMQDEGVGGSGDVGQGQDDAWGGSGQVGQKAPKAQQGIPIQGQGGMTLYCTPVQQGATGGSGDLGLQGDEQSSLQRGYDVQVGEVDVKDDKAFGGSGYEIKDEDKANMRGLTVMVGAGVEGYTGGLAPEVDPGAAVNVTAAIRPSKVLGLELGYNGAVNNLDADVAGSGPDIVRNGAQANLTFGLAATPVQPYVLGGFGMNWYNVRNGQALGFRDDTNSKIPLGVGLRTHVGSFTADLRANYNVLIGDDFAPAVNNDDVGTGSYNGMLNIGGTF